MKSQGLPLSTIVLLVLVILVLIAIGILFASEWSAGAGVISSEMSEAIDGPDTLTNIIFN